jgi:hypothetical protein
LVYAYHPDQRAMFLDHPGELLAQCRAMVNLYS